MIYLHFSISVCYKRLSRAFHLHIFSHPAGTQCADCIMYLATNHFVSVWVDNCLSASSLVSHIYTFFSLNMSEHVSFLCFILCLFSVYFCPHRLSRATYQHIFSRLVGAQFADCITCLANTYFVLVCTGYYIFASLLIFLSLNMSVYVSFLCFTSFHPSVLP